MEMGLADVTLVVYHPDKQRDQARRLAAQNRFTAIQRAYEGRFTEALHEDLTLAVLTDPQKRAVYDMFGEEGLRTNWEVGPRLKTPEEVNFSTGQAADNVSCAHTSKDKHTRRSSWTQSSWSSPRLVCKLD